MGGWGCGLRGCDGRFATAEAVLRHQVTEHEPTECAVCGRRVPAGFFAIHHAFEEHTRAEYVRAYDASADEIREREDIKAAIEDRVDVQALIDGFGLATETPTPSAGD